MTDHHCHETDSSADSTTSPQTGTAVGNICATYAARTLNMRHQCFALEYSLVISRYKVGITALHAPYFVN